MASVTQLIDGVSQSLNEPRDKVNKYARALIDAGLFPKSKGRAVAQVELIDFVRLIAALCLEPKIKDTAKMVSEYLALPLVGRDLESGESVSDLSATAEQTLIRIFEIILDEESPGQNADLRASLFKGEIQFTTNFPMIEVSYPASEGLGGTLTERYKPVGDDMLRDAEMIRRSSIIKPGIVLLTVLKIHPDKPADIF